MLRRAVREMAAERFIDHSTARCKALLANECFVVILVDLPILLSLFTGIVLGDPGIVGQSVTRMVVRDVVVWRVPVAPRPMQQLIMWVEKKGPTCVPIGEIRRAMLSGPGKVDFVLADRTRIRAQFDDKCPALDYYAGLYLLPENDSENLCAHRDSIHSRMGGSCEIERFRILRPRLRS